MELTLILIVLTVFNGLLFVAMLLFTLRLRHRFKDKFLELTNLQAELSRTLSQINTESQNIYTRLLQEAEKNLVNTCDNLQARIEGHASQVSSYIEKWQTSYREEITDEITERLSKQVKTFHGLARERHDALARELVRLHETPGGRSTDSLN